MKKMKLSAILILAVALLVGCSTPTESAAAKKNSTLSTQVSRLTKQNKATAARIADDKQSMADDQSTIADLQKELNNDKAAVASSTKKEKAPQKSATDLANLNYDGTGEIVVNNNDPGFSAADLSTAKGAWEQYADLDKLNRATDANALLNHSLMPTTKRTALTWDPTGWRNKRTAHGWLYNRSHLIGFQLSGENNNPKNLITGTQTLNNPEMLAHEMDIAYYLKQSDQHFVRYEVKPIYRGDELVARGVQMRAQSTGDNTIRFNVYIFNVEPGYTINYTDGTSVKG